MDHSRSKFFNLSNALRSWPAGIAALVLLLLAIAYKIFSEGGEISVLTGSSDLLELSGGTFPQYRMFTSSFIHSVWPLTLLAFLLATAAIRLSTTIARSRDQSSIANVDDQSGSSAVELVLVFPVLMVLLMLILQIALIVQAKFVVNYAAFCAARSAIVVIPDEIARSRGVPGEGRNQLADANQSKKIETIQHAAALPLTALSPLPDWKPATGLPFLGNIGDGLHLGLLAPFELDFGSLRMVQEVVKRGPYAYDEENTQVKVLTIEGAEARSFKEHDFVRVQVTYRYYLAVPFAKKFFGTPYYNNRFINMIFGTDYFYPITEEYTLPVDGEPLVP